jgi:drug/metabolite transporter (DMT)-like permease
LIDDNSKPPTVLQVALALGAVYVLWGSTYLAIAVAIETIPPLLMAGVRYLIAGAILYGWSRWRGAARPSRIHWRSAILVGGFLLLGGNGALVWAEQRLPSGTAALLVSTMPLWMVLIEWLRPGGSRPQWKVFAGVGLGLAGLALLVRPTASGHIDIAGAVVLVLGAMSWAWGSLRSREISLPESPLLATAMEMLSGGAMLVLGGAVLGETGRVHLAQITLRSALGLGYLITFGALIGFTAYVWLLRRVASPVLVGTYAYINPIVAVFLGWLFLSEPLTGRTLIAAAVIISGVVLITLSRRAPAPVPAALPAREEELSLSGSRTAACRLPG